MNAAQRTACKAENLTPNWAGYKPAGSKAICTQMPLNTSGKAAYAEQWRNVDYNEAQEHPPCDVVNTADRLELEGTAIPVIVLFKTKHCTRALGEYPTG